MAFARGPITQSGAKPISALWSGVCRHVPRAKTMARKRQSSSKATSATPQTVPPGFELLANAAASTPAHIGARKETDGATLIQPTLPHMCNSGGVLHGGYMMSFANSGVNHARHCSHGMAPRPHSRRNSWRRATHNRRS